jgi:hypothetical protein
MPSAEPSAKRQRGNARKPSAKSGVGQQVRDLLATASKTGRGFSVQYTFGTTEQCVQGMFISGCRF